MTARTRREARRQRHATFWALRYAAADTPAGRAAVAFDHLRARITDLPAGERDDAWDDMGALLDAQYTNVSSHGENRNSGGQRTGTRPRARDNHNADRTVKHPARV